jgi:glycerol-3-phosphate cytidylyltransferase
MKTIITFGTFDLLHIGHVKILERAKQLGDKLIVGVSSDEFNFLKKNHYPVYNETERMEIIKSIKYVDYVFLEESFELKKKYIVDYKADILVMGSDWNGKFDDLGIDVCIFDRTDNISTTETINKISFSQNAH